MERRELLKPNEVSPAGGALVHTHVTSGGGEVLSIGLMPEDIDHLIERLSFNDRALAMCLEALVLCVRPDGTAFFSEVASRYRDVHMQNVRHTEALTEESNGQLHLEDVRTLLASSVLPRLAHAEVIALPPGGLSAADALITVTDRRLRLSLREPGRMLLARALHRHNALYVSGPNARTERRLVEPGEYDAWAQIWFAVQRHTWSILAIVPASPGENAFEAAQSLVVAGQRYHAGPVELIDATGAEPGATSGIMAMAADAVDRGAQAIIALDSPLTNAAAISVARSADAVLLAVRLGGPKIEVARRAIEGVGRECFIGTIALR